MKDLEVPVYITPTEELIERLTRRVSNSLKEMDHPVLNLLTKEEMMELERRFVLLTIDALRKEY